MLTQLKELLEGLSWKMLAGAASKVPAPAFTVASTGLPLEDTDLTPGILFEQPIGRRRTGAYGIFGKLRRFQSTADFKTFCSSLVNSLPEDSEIVFAVHNLPVVLGPSLAQGAERSLVHEDGPVWCNNAAVYMFIRMPDASRATVLQNSVNGALFEGGSSFLSTDEPILGKLLPAECPDRFTAVRCISPVSKWDSLLTAPILLPTAETWDVYHLHVPNRHAMLTRAAMRGDRALRRAHELSRPISMSRTLFVGADIAGSAQALDHRLSKRSVIKGASQRAVQEVIAQLRNQGCDARYYEQRNSNLAFSLGLPWQLPLETSLRLHAKANRHLVVDLDAALNSIGMPVGQAPLAQLPQPVPTLRAKNQYGEATLFEDLHLDGGALTVIQGHAGTGLTHYSNALFAAKLQAGLHGWSIRVGSSTLLDKALNAEILVLEQFKPVSINPLYGYETADAFYMAADRLRIWLRSVARLATHPGTHREEYEFNRAVAHALEVAWQRHGRELGLSHVLAQLRESPETESAALAILLGAAGVGQAWFEGKPDVDVSRPCVSIVLDHALPQHVQHVLAATSLALFWNQVEKGEACRPTLLVDGTEVLNDNAAELLRGVVRRLRVFRGQAIITTRRLSPASRKDSRVAGVLLDNLHRHVLLRGHATESREWLEPHTSSQHSLYHALEFLDRRGNAIVLEASSNRAPRLIEPLVDESFRDWLR